jgi:hypothetical protein
MLVLAVKASLARVVRIVLNDAYHSDNTAFKITFSKVVFG